MAPTTISYMNVFLFFFFFLRFASELFDLPSGDGFEFDLVLWSLHNTTVDVIVSAKTVTTLTERCVVTLRYRDAL